MHTSVGADSAQQHLSTTTACYSIPFPNSGFEEGEAEWTIAKGRGDCRVIAVEFPDSRQALQVKATTDTNGARIDGPLVPCAEKGIIEFYGSIRSVSGRALGLWVYHLDADGNVLPGEFWECIESQDGVWHRHTLLGAITPHPRAAFLKVTIIAYPPAGEVVEAYFDDFAFSVPSMRIPPLPRQYKMRPDDREQLTPADVVGPDGIVYPNWTQVGVQGGIPDVPVALRLADMGAKPGTDISGLLNEACRKVGAQGGGAIEIGGGIYHLDNPVTIRDSGVVIRGAGRHQTHLLFRYSLAHPQPTGPATSSGQCLHLPRRHGRARVPVDRRRPARRYDAVRGDRP